MFLKSSFAQSIELENLRFANNMKQLEAQGKYNQSSAMWQGIGTIAGLALGGPIGAFMGSKAGSVSSSVGTSSPASSSPGPVADSAPCAYIPGTSIPAKYNF
jgi:hypothetical protein